jgi:hypothetical protein
MLERQDNKSKPDIEAVAIAWIIAFQLSPYVDHIKKMRKMI